MMYFSSFIKVRKNIFINPTYQLIFYCNRYLYFDNTNNNYRWLEVIRSYSRSLFVP